MNRSKAIFVSQKIEHVGANWQAVRMAKMDRLHRCIYAVCSARLREKKDKA